MLLCSITALSVSGFHFSDCIDFRDVPLIETDRHFKSFSFDLNDYFSFFQCWIKTTEALRETFGFCYFLELISLELLYFGKFLKGTA